MDERSDEQNGNYNRLMDEAHHLRRSKLYSQAAEVFFAASRVAEGSEQEALLLYATCLKEAENYSAANLAYQFLLAKHPNFATGWSLYGVFLKSLKNFESSINAFRRSLDIKEDPGVLNALVVSLYRVGKLDEAQIEGLRNLYLKDKLASLNFNSTPEKYMRLEHYRAKRFDPYNRKRNIISFSLWGSDPVYLRGAIINAQIAPYIYYGWTCRFYCDSSVPDDAIRQLRDVGAEIVIVGDPKLQVIRPMWRFLVSDDPNIDWFICRDADSRLNCQELLAVEDWLRSGVPFHIMRDHILHMDLILAGMWGGAARVLPNIGKLLLLRSQYFNNRHGDQAFLANEIWPLIREHSLAHDTYYHFFNGRDFPSCYQLPRPVHVGGAVKSVSRRK